MEKNKIYNSDGILKKECRCIDPKIHTDENGINYCKECKVETEIFRNIPYIPLLGAVLLTNSKI